MVWGVDMGPLPITKPKNGSGFAQAMGLDGAVCRYGSDWYDFESKSKAVWPSSGVEGRREWSRWCWFKDPNYCGSPLKREEERGGSIMFGWYVRWWNMVVTFWTPVLMASYWIPGGHLATNTSRRD